MSPRMDSLDLGSLRITFHFSHPQNFKLSADIYNSLFEFYWSLYWFTKVKALLADCHSWPDSRWRTCGSFLQLMATCRRGDCRGLGNVHWVYTAKLESLSPTQVSWVLWFNSPPMLWRLKCSGISNFTYFGQVFGCLWVKNCMSRLLKFLDFIGRRNCIFVLFWTFTLGCSLLVFVDIEEKIIVFFPEIRGMVFGWRMCCLTSFKWHQHPNSEDHSGEFLFWRILLMFFLFVYFAVVCFCCCFFPTSKRGLPFL